MSGTLKCFDCYLAEQSDLYACPTHATPEQRKEMDERVKKLADMKHPLLGNMPWQDRKR